MVVRIVPLKQGWKLTMEIDGTLSVVHLLNDANKHATFVFRSDSMDFNADYFTDESTTECLLDE